MQRLQYYVTRVFLGVVALAALAGIWGTAQAGALLQTTTLSPGTSLTVSCATVLSVKMANDKKSLRVSCAAASSPTPQPSATKTRTPTTIVPTRTPTAVAPTITRTRRPTRTATVVPPTPTATPMHQHPTATVLVPTATPSAGGNTFPTVNPLILGSCPVEVHDRYATTGPDGKQYRTWHPVIVPIDLSDLGRGTCSFAHDHGADPRTSEADNSLPAFGYVVNKMREMGHNHSEEPHEGFKVHVFNRGMTNSPEQRTAQISGRLVFHMGTGGPGRIDMQFHSFEYDMVSPTGHYAHLQGMADTGLFGNICERDRTLSDNDPTNDIGRVLQFTKNANCQPDSLYEWWAFTFAVYGFDGQEIIRAGGAIDTVDPITVFDPLTRGLVSTDLEYANLGGAPYHGCHRGVYFRTPYWYNPYGPTTVWTDGMGNRVADNQGLEQRFSSHTDIGIVASQPDAQTTHRQDFNYCTDSLGTKN